MIHNISIASGDDVIHIGNYVYTCIYHFYFSRAIVIWGNYLHWLEKTLFQVIFLPISCNLIWELTRGHRVHIHVCNLDGVLTLKVPYTIVKTITKTLIEP